MLLAWGNYHSFAVAWPGCMCSHFHPSYLEQDLHVPMSGCAGAGVQLGNVRRPDALKTSVCLWTSQVCLLLIAAQRFFFTTQRPPFAEN
jgi:hypothetical protein